jgi:hypothetical protein
MTPKLALPSFTSRTLHKIMRISFSMILFSYVANLIVFCVLIATVICGR